MEHSLFIFTLFIVSTSAIFCDNPQVCSSIGDLTNIFFRGREIEDQPSAVIVQPTRESLSPGDLIMIIQMKGGVINTSSNYGNIDDLGNVGYFEFATVNDTEIIDANQKRIYVENRILRPFDSTGSNSFQVIRVPNCVTINLSTSIECTPWDPATQTGGVVAFAATTINFNNFIISCDGGGYQGAPPPTEPCRDFDPQLACGSGIGEGKKGEGIATPDGANAFCTGKYGNGGGGGSCDDKTAGGGGGLGTPGLRDEEDAGYGGEDIPVASFLRNNTLVRLIMGGGGGSSAEPSEFDGSAGGNGGGIVFLYADVIDDTCTVNSNGLNGEGSENNSFSTELEDGGDGAGDNYGGGGAGGSIALFGNAAWSTCSVSAGGGNLGGSGIVFTSANSLLLTNQEILSAGTSLIPLSPCLESASPSPSAFPSNQPLSQSPQPSFSTLSSLQPSSTPRISNSPSSLPSQPFATSTLSLSPTSSLIFPTISSFPLASSTPTIRLSISNTASSNVGPETESVSPSASPSLEISATRGTNTISSAPAIPSFSSTTSTIAPTPSNLLDVDIMGPSAFPTIVPLPTQILPPVVIEDPATSGVPPAPLNAGIAECDFTQELLLDNSLTQLKCSGFGPESPVEVSIATSRGIPIDAVISYPVPIQQPHVEIVSTVIDITVQSQFDSATLCFQVKNNTSKSESCLGYYDTNENRWVCEDKCLHENDKGYYCGSTSHFTSFAILLQVGNGDSCGNDWIYITGSAKGDSILIACMFGLVCCCCIFILAAASTTFGERAIKGKHGMEVSKMLRSKTVRNPEIIVRSYHR